MSTARLKFVVMDEGSACERWFIDTRWSGTDRSHVLSPSDLLPLRGGRAQAIELGFTADEPDPRDARIAELEADVTRLRKRTHEIAEQKDREHARGQRQLGEMGARIYRARDWANASLVAHWTKDPHASWWSHGSEHNRMAVLGLLEIIDRLAARLRADPTLPSLRINPEHANDFVSYTELMNALTDASECMRCGNFGEAEKIINTTLARRAKLKETTT